MNTLIGACSDILILIARIFLMVLFLTTGWKKITNFSGTTTYMASLGAPAPALATIVAIVMECFVAIALILGVYTRFFALIFAVFTVVTAFLGHHFWTMEGDTRKANEINFFKNISICGGLLLLVVTGAGRYALMH